MNKKLLSIYCKYYIALLPIYIANILTGNVLYKENKISLSLYILSILGPIFILVFTYLLEYIYHIGIKKEKTLYKVVSSSLPYFNLLCYFIGNYNSFLLSIALILLFTIGNKFIKVNYISLFQILLYMSVILQKEYVTNTYALIYLLISFFLLFVNKYYKKDIAILSISTYFATVLCISSFHDIPIGTIFSHLIHTDILFVLLFVSTLNQYSPATRIGKVLYSICIGISFGFCIEIIQEPYAVSIVLLLISSCLSIFDKKVID